LVKQGIFSVKYGKAAVKATNFIRCRYIAPSKSPPEGETLASPAFIFLSPPYRGGFRWGLNNSLTNSKKLILKTICSDNVKTSIPLFLLVLSEGVLYPLKTVFLAEFYSINVL